MGIQLRIGCISGQNVPDFAGLCNPKPLKLLIVRHVLVSGRLSYHAPLSASGQPNRTVVGEKTVLLGWPEALMHVSPWIDFDGEAQGFRHCRE